MGACSKDNGSWNAGHTWRYYRSRWGGEPLRGCDSCDRVEAYYCDDLELEEIMLGGSE